MNPEIQKQFVPFEIAKLIDEKQFNELCFAYFHGDGGFETLSYPLRNDSMLDGFTAPSFAQAIDWFIEKHDLEINVKSWKGEGDGKITWIYSVKAIGVPSTYRFNTKSSSRLEAWNKAIIQAFTLIK